MNEANSNAFSINSESHVELSSTSNTQAENIQAIEGCGIESSHLVPDNLDQDKLPSQNAESESSEQKMNWQKVAHKLREYNRKLLKKVFRLERDLAEIDNKFNKQTEKSRSSDLLVAKQAEEIEACQEMIANFEHQINQQTSGFQKLIDQQQAVIDNLSLQYDLSQKQTAQIERDCALLQEEHNNKTYELTLKEKETKDLRSKLSQQQRTSIQYKAEIERLKDQIKVEKLTRAGTAIENVPMNQSSSDKRSIKPWSVAPISETGISLPKTKFPGGSKPPIKASETIKTAAKIATWSASEATYQKQPKAKEKVKSSPSKKPQSLAAVDLPTFPRPQ